MVKTTIATRRAEAKRRWLQEWQTWAANNIPEKARATETEALAFYKSRKNAPGLAT
jgi:hypothetical protein